MRSTSWILSLKLSLGLGLLVPQAIAAVTIAPTAFTLAAGQALPVTLTGATSGVSWSVSPMLGTVTGGLSSATYTAPTTVSQNQTVQVIATVASPAATVKTTVTLIPAVTLTVSPASADVMSGNQQTFTAAVTGSTNSAVTWSASLGTISSSGVYLAPTVNSDTTDTVTATSQADPTKSATALVRVHSRTGAWFVTGSGGLTSLTFNGINYNYVYGEGLVTSVTTATSGGSVKVTPVCTGSFTPTSISKHCTTTGADSVDVTVTFSTPAAGGNVITAPGSHVGTIRADVTITNNSTTDTVTQAMLSILGVSMAQYNATASHVVALDTSNAVSYVNYQVGQWAIWNNAPTPDVTSNMACGWSYVCKNQPLINSIAPGQTKNASFSLRFTDDTTALPYYLAPEAYSAYSAAYPGLVNWPDRRPIMAWFLADHSHQSATNPRGYLFDPTIDVSNVAAFQSKVMSQAQSMLTQIQGRPVKPQGIIIWDLEGEEFIQPTTYVGDPRVFDTGYAPEMQATADGVFKLFRDAGLRVGITLRPQAIQWGTTLPSQCIYNSDMNYRDYFIKVDGGYGQKFYACNDPAGLSWTLIPAGNGGQTFNTSNQVQQVTNLLLSKAQYAHQRWGTTLFYVDTSVWVGGAPLPQDIFRALQLAMPDSLFIPEENYIATMGVAMPYSEPKNTGSAKYAPPSWRAVYPSGALGIYLSNCSSTCWTANVANFDIGQKVGDIPIYTTPTATLSAQFLAVESMIQQARSEAGTITVTDSSTGAQFSYNGSPSTVYQYPVKMRVYFAADAASLPASATYCESGQLNGENTCTLNLAGLLTAQIRYYDFNNQLVITGSPQAR